MIHLCPNFNHEYFYLIKLTFLRLSKAIESRHIAHWVFPFRLKAQPHDAIEYVLDCDFKVFLSIGLATQCDEIQHFFTIL